MRRFALLAALLATPAVSLACAIPTRDHMAIAKALDEIDGATPAPPEAAVPADQAVAEAPTQVVTPPVVNPPAVPVLAVPVHPTPPPTSAAPSKS